MMTRAEAKALGLARYFSGKRCLAGHRAERWVYNWGCCECKKEDQRQRYTNDSEYREKRQTSCTGEVSGKGIHMKRERLITAHGQTLPITEWAKRTGLGRVTIYKRLSRGMSPDDAVSQPLQRRRTLTANGETLTVPEWAERLGTTQSIIRQRIRAGWIESDACLLPVQQGYYAKRREARNGEA